MGSTFEAHIDRFIEGKLSLTVNDLALEYFKKRKKSEKIALYPLVNALSKTIER